MFQQHRIVFVVTVVIVICLAVLLVPAAGRGSTPPERLSPLSPEVSLPSAAMGCELHQPAIAWSSDGGVFGIWRDHGDLVVRFAPDAGLEFGPEHAVSTGNGKPRAALAADSEGLFRVA